MSFWIIALLLAAACAGLLVMAALRGGASWHPASEFDIKVYRDQLREVEKDVARGVLSAEDAERARLEISRRILDADRALGAEGPRAAEPRLAGVGVAVAMALAVVAGGAALYSRLGAPGYPDLPLKTRIALAEEARAERPSQQEAEATIAPVAGPVEPDPAYAELVERLRAVVAERPNDPQGLALLARNEAGLGNFAAAHAAQARLIAVKGDAATAEDHAIMADLLVLAAGGYVSPEAEAELVRALELDPRNPTARYYSGLMFAQTGRPDLAFRFWQALLSEGPADAPWIPPIRAQIEEIAMLAGVQDFTLPAEPAAPRGPSAADVAAAQDMAPEARMQMIRGMVEGLAERLATEGGPAEDWARLITALGVLGEADRAVPVLEEARATFAGDAAGLAVIEEAARGAGLGQ